MKILYVLFFLILIPLHKLYSQNEGHIPELDSLITAFKKSDSLESKIDLAILISQKAVSSDFKLSLQYAKTSLALTDQQNDLAKKLLAVENAGNIAFYMGLSKEAVDLKLRAFDLADALGDLYSRAVAYFNLGATQLYLDQLEEAQKNITTAQDLFREFYQDKEEPMPSNVTFSLLNNLGQIALKLGDYSLAETHYRQGKEMITKQESKKGDAEFRLLSGYAQLKLFQNLPMEAIALGEEVMQEFNKTGDPNLQFKSNIFNSLGQAWEKLNQVDSALYYYRKNYQIASQSNSIAGLRIVAKDLARIFELKNQPDSALYFIKIAENLMQEEDQATAKAELQHAELIKVFRLKEEEILQTETQKRVDLTLVLITVLAAISGLSLVSWQKNRKVKYAVEEIEKELFTKALDDIQKSETMRSLINELRGALRNKEQADPNLLKVLNKIERSTVNQNILEEFKLRFEVTHQTFYNNLLQKHPELTSNERRLCAFLRLDMTTKEIATINGQSVRAIQMARIRLRKKLKINSRQSTLFNYLNQF